MIFPQRLNKINCKILVIKTSLATKDRKNRIFNAIKHILSCLWPNVLISLIGSIYVESVFKVVTILFFQKNCIAENNHKLLKLMFRMLLLLFLAPYEPYYTTSPQPATGSVDGLSGGVSSYNDQATNECLTSSNVSIPNTVAVNN